MIINTDKIEGTVTGEFGIIEYKVEIDAFSVKHFFNTEKGIECHHSKTTLIPDSSYADLLNPINLIEKCFSTSIENMISWCETEKEFLEQFCKSLIYSSVFVGDIPSFNVPKSYDYLLHIRYRDSETGLQKPAIIWSYFWEYVEKQDSWEDASYLWLDKLFKQRSKSFALWWIQQSKVSEIADTALAKIYDAIYDYTYNNFINGIVTEFEIKDALSLKDLYTLKSQNNCVNQFVQLLPSNIYKKTSFKIDFENEK